MPYWYFHKRLSLITEISTNSIQQNQHSIHFYISVSYKSISFVLICVMVACLHILMSCDYAIRGVSKNMLTVQVLFFGGGGAFKVTANCKAKDINEPISCFCSMQKTIIHRATRQIYSPTSIAVRCPAPLVWFDLVLEKKGPPELSVAYTSWQSVYFRN